MERCATVVCGAVLGVLTAATLPACDAGLPAGTTGGTGGTQENGDAGLGGAGGAPETTGTGGASVPTNPIADVSLDDTFPWFLRTAATSTLTTLMGAPDDTGRNFLRVASPEDPTQFTVSTHHHFEVIAYAHRISFAARTSVTVPLRVSLRRALNSVDYFGALAEGDVWPSAVVQATADWQHFTVALDELQPAEVVVDGGGLEAGFMLAFAVQGSGFVELDLDDVHIE